MEWLLGYGCTTYDQSIVVASGQLRKRRTELNIIVQGYKTMDRVTFRYYLTIEETESTWVAQVR